MCRHSRDTGVFNGVICRLELKLHRPIKWIICLLHFNEFPLQHLFERKSSGTSSYAGNIGRNLKGCEKLPLVAFNSIEYNLTDIDTSNLSCDHKHLLDICTDISSGFGSSDLAKRQPFKLNLAFWLTTANRILRLYILTSDPTLVVFILRVYPPSWNELRFILPPLQKSEVALHGIFPTVTPVVTKVLAAVRTLARFGISDRAGAVIVSAAVQNEGIISESNVLNVVDRNKIRRGRTKVGNTLLSQVIKDYDHDQFGLYFDGRKDGTLSMEDNRRKFIIE
ncbi:hypothetical protein AVEN_182574-1 [Araneus ventricosus]|uniref:Uncharacterized protein n=1 Tax=Araneus ventricosus TaxID=182803 RepID=A0A4Y2TFU8_ARAVE|nr:hypothetical protein AVEN_182574-1 [Araneus ventricosus]